MSLFREIGWQFKDPVSRLVLLFTVVTMIVIVAPIFMVFLERQTETPAQGLWLSFFSVIGFSAADLIIGKKLLDITKKQDEYDG